MEYKNILEKLAEINDSNFTMNSLIELAKLWQKASCVYGTEQLEKRIDAKECYDEVSGKIREVAFDKLKNKLGFEDEVINKIVSLMVITDKIEEIYVLDGYVASKLSNNQYTLNQEELVFASKFVNITSKEFNDSDDKLKNLVVKSISNAILPLVNVKNPNGVVVVNDGTVRYNVTEINIYLNHTLNEILSDTTGLLMTKIFVKYKDTILCFDLKVNGEYIFIGKDEDKVNISSEMLNNKEKLYRQ